MEMGVVGRMPSGVKLDVLLEFEISNPGLLGKVFWHRNGLDSRHAAAQLEASIDISKKPVLARVHVDNLACREKKREYIYARVGKSRKLPRRSIGRQERYRPATIFLIFSHDSELLVQGAPIMITSSIIPCESVFESSSSA